MKNRTLLFRRRYKHFWIFDGWEVMHHQRIYWYNYYFYIAIKYDDDDIGYNIERDNFFRI